MFFPYFYGKDDTNIYHRIMWNRIKQLFLDSINAWNIISRQLHSLFQHPYEIHISTKDWLIKKTILLILL